MSTRLVVAGVTVIWCGATLALSSLPSFVRRDLVERLRPYQPGAAPARRLRARLSLASLGDVFGPLAADAVARAAQLFGVDEDLATRLHRVHAPIDPAGFRLRQLGWSVGAFGAGAVLAALLPLPLPVALFVVLAAPVLAFLVLEHQLSAASQRWQEHLFLELPVVCEQLGMLLAAGHPLGAALRRIAVRGRGACALDLDRVTNRIQQGLSEADALREWADLSDVPEVRQVVRVLSLERTTADLGQLMSREARTIREEVQRRRIEQLERRAQQVWIPVTVATLVPGVIFIAIPFVEALRFFAGS